MTREQNRQLREVQLMMPKVFLQTNDRLADGTKAIRLVGENLDLVVESFRSKIRCGLEKMLLLPGDRIDLRYTILVDENGELIAVPSTDRERSNAPIKSS